MSQMLSIGLNLNPEYSFKFLKDVTTTRESIILTALSPNIFQISIRTLQITVKQTTYGLFKFIIHSEMLDSLSCRICGKRS